MQLSLNGFSSMASSQSTDHQTEELIPEQKASIPCLAFWPDGSRLIAVVGPGLQIWNVKEKTREGEAIRCGFFTNFTTVAVSTDGKKFATGGTYRDGGQVLLWDANARRIEHTFDKPAISRCLCVVHFSSDTRFLVFAFEREYMSDSLEVRNTTDGSCVCVLEPRKGNNRCTRFSPDDKRLAACGVCIQIWELATGRPSLEIKQRAHSLEWTKDGSRVIANNLANGQLMMYDAHTGTQIRCWRDHAGGIPAPQLWPYICMSVSPDGRFLASVRGNVVHVWDLENVREVARYSFPRDMFCVAYSPNGDFIVSGAYICKAPKKHDTLVLNNISNQRSVAE
ncbi:quinon protein alcohol dehydrogenase-like superfamily [Butyriboletus roseoflavus]|nr:quinon protein alcohol dehydrogenase-like superfamily [Butyriboletus roseoflavus]